MTNAIGYKREALSQWIDLKHEYVRKQEEIVELDSEADILLVTYGAWGGIEGQETPPYTLELARRHPEKRVDLIHYDDNFLDSIKKWLSNPNREHGQPLCVRSDEWKLIDSRNRCRLQFEHTQFPNLRITLIAKTFPTTKRSDFAGFWHPPGIPVWYTLAPIDKFRIKQFQDLVRNKVEQGKQVFLGAHAWSYGEDEGVMAPLYNELSKKHPNNIHMYIHAGGGRPAWVYSNREHHEVFGEFVYDYKHLSCPQGFFDSLAHEAFLERTFTVADPAASDVAKVRDCMARFIQKYQKNAQEAKELYSYLDNSRGRFRMMPLHAITPATFGLGGEHHPDAQETSATTMEWICNAAYGFSLVATALLVYSLAPYLFALIL